MDKATRKKRLLKNQTQIIGCRVTKEQWHQLEQKCLANQVTMSMVLQQAVAKYINN